MADADISQHLQNVQTAIESANRCLRDKDSSPNSALRKIRKAMEVHSVLNGSIPAQESGKIGQSLSALERMLEDEMQESSRTLNFKAKILSTGNFQVMSVKKGLY